MFKIFEVVPRVILLRTPKYQLFFSLKIDAQLKLGRYHDINLDTILISDGFGFNRNIDISRYRDISINYRDVQCIC